MNIKDLIIYSDVTIREAMLRLDDVSKGIVFVVNNEEKLQGTITDGDIRRWILKNGSMDEKVTSVMNNNPIYVMDSDDIDIMDIMVKKSISAIPVINECKILNR